MFKVKAKDNMSAGDLPQLKRNSMFCTETIGKMP